MRYNPFGPSPSPATPSAPPKRTPSSRSRGASLNPEALEAKLEAHRERKSAQRYAQFYHLLDHWDVEAVAIMLDVTDHAVAAKAKSAWVDFIRSCGCPWKNNGQAMAAFRTWFFQRSAAAEVAPGRSDSGAAGARGAGGADQASSAVDLDLLLAVASRV